MENLDHHHVDTLDHDFLEAFRRRMRVLMGHALRYFWHPHLIFSHANVFPLIYNTHPICMRKQPGEEGGGAGLKT